MGGRAQGYRITWKRGWAYARFTHSKTDYRIALGTKDPEEARERAEREYGAVLSGQRKPLTSAGRVGRTLLAMPDLLAEWIASQEGVLDPETCATLTTYAKHYIAFFGTLDRVVAKGATADYWRARLRVVLRRTVLKELSYLRGFLTWCVEHGALEEAPLVPVPSKKATGKRSGKQRATPVEIDAAQAAAIIALLPEHSKKIGGRKWPIRGRFKVAWETGLRPETLDLLAVPGNFSKGGATITLDDHEDKARFGRTIPLTEVARATLDAVAPDAGLIFGAHRFDKALKKAATRVLGPELGKKFAAYDFRHGRVTHLLDGGAPLTGAAFLVGHKRLTTTDHYSKPSRRAADRALAALGESAPCPPHGENGAAGGARNSAESLGDRPGLNRATPGATRQDTSKIPAENAGEQCQKVPADDTKRHGIRTRGGFRRRLPEDAQDAVAEHLDGVAAAVSEGDEPAALAGLAKAADVVMGATEVAS
jgi:integrase